VVFVSAQVNPGDEIREGFETLRTLLPQYAHELVDTLERRLILAEAMLALHERLMATEKDGDLDHAKRWIEETQNGTLIPFPGHSVKVS
jgi:hypothetical protein